MVPRKAKSRFYLDSWSPDLYLKNCDINLAINSSKYRYHEFDTDSHIRTQFILLEPAIWLQKHQKNCPESHSYIHIYIYMTGDSKIF